MGKIPIGAGTKFLLNNRAYEIEAEIEKNVYSVFDIEFPLVKKNYSYEQLSKLLQESKLEFSEYGKNTKGDFVKKYDFDDFSMLPEELQKKALFRYEVIKPLVYLEVDFLSPYIDMRVNEFEAKGEKVSRASIYRWLSDYRTGNYDIRSLVSSYHRRGKGKRLNKEVEMVIERFIDKYYLAKERRTVKTIFELISHQINVENKSRLPSNQLQLPSESTVLRRIKERDEFEITKSRKGKKAAWQKYGQVQLFDKPTYPLQRAEVDHTPLDLFVVDTKTRLPIGRPWLTSVLDVFTGYPLGFYIGFEPPSYTSVMHALNHAIFSKKDLKGKYKLENNWVAHGLPELLVVDNGKEFLSKHLESACLQLEMELYHCPVKSAWYKGAVERYFRTINQSLLHQTKGTTFSNVLDKGEYNPKKNAIIGFEKLLEYIYKWVVDYYAIDFNSGVKGVPLHLWEKSFEVIPAPALPSSGIDWKIALMKLEKGSIQRTGIRFKHLFYQSDKLAFLRHKIDSKANKNSVEFKYDPTDLSKIFVYDPFDYSYIEVLCTDQAYADGLNEYTHNVIVKKLNEEKKSIDKAALAAARHALVQMLEIEEKQTLTERKNILRIKAVSSNQEWTSDKKKPKTVEETGSAKVFDDTEVKMTKPKKDKKIINLYEGEDMDEEWEVWDAE
ncbi:Mu transposase C-terminal domain-containing protein [Lysinibacillus sp. FSL L8-0126]|uniref:Mu transposase C-terminal domain-containing protein n=1 Tax=Lysinibacillus sp. FSL L8-0126 TaxID=2921515 RepID=UPI0031599C91